MTKRRRIVAIIVGLVLFAGLFGILASTEHQVGASQEDGAQTRFYTPEFATDGSAGAETFGALLRRYQHIQFTELVSGDASAFPTIFYDDSEYPVNQDWQDLIDTIGLDSISSAISSYDTGPIGSEIEHGFLTAKKLSQTGMRRAFL